MIRNLIWDFDGTLFDTYPVSGGNFQRCIEKAYGVNEDVDEIMAKMKNSFDTAMEFYANKYGFGQDFCRAFYHVNDSLSIKVQQKCRRRLSRPASCAASFAGVR